jgi:hypothetical protein
MEFIDNANVKIWKYSSAKRLDATYLKPLRVVGSPVVCLNDPVIEAKLVECFAGLVNESVSVCDEANPSSFIKRRTDDTCRQHGFSGSCRKHDPDFCVALSDLLSDFFDGFILIISQLH